MSAWGGNTISAFRARGDGTLIYERRIAVGRHPSALLANRAGSRLFVALAGTDQIAVIDAHKWIVLRHLSDAAPEGPAEGSTPSALALSPDESKLFVAEADNNAVAVFDVSAERRETPSARDPLRGRIPTDWYPTAILESDNGLLVLNGKGHGSRPIPTGRSRESRSRGLLGTLLGISNGTLRIQPDTFSPAQLAAFSSRVAAANRWPLKRQEERYPPFKHVIYIIKENRTYDQVLGDLKEGDGDPNLLFFGPP